MRFTVGYKEALVVVGAGCFFIYFAIYSFHQNEIYWEGRNCTHQLAQIARAMNTMVTLKKIKTDKELQDALGTPPAYPGLSHYLRNKKVNGPKGDWQSISCPAGGEYTLPETFDPITHKLNDPFCSLGLPLALHLGLECACYPHSLTPVPRLQQ